MKINVTEAIMMGAGHLEVYCNGERIERAFMVDTENGVVGFYPLQDGKPVIEAGEIKRAENRGHITVMCEGRLVAECAEPLLEPTHQCPERPQRYNSRHGSGINEPPSGPPPNIDMRQ